MLSIKAKLNLQLHFKLHPIEKLYSYSEPLSYTNAQVTKYLNLWKYHNTLQYLEKIVLKSILISNFKL